MSELKKFPDEFLWGAATASYQVEGGIENTDWAKAAREGRVPVCGRACDHYNRYEADFNIVKNLGHNAHRFSIEWTRIEPEEGVFDETAIEHYKKVLNALQSRGITPFITLYHFTLPLWFSEGGGWERKDAPELFARYSKYVVDHLKDDCAHYATINEPIVMSSNGWLRGNWPPFKKGRLVQFLSVSRNLARAHNAAYKLVKEDHPDLDLGIVKDNIYFHANWNPVNKVIAAFMNWFWNRRFLNMIKNHCDSIGLNYYFHNEFGGKKKYEKNDFGWDLFPEGIYHTLMELTCYKKALYIAEAGTADEDDDHRGRYIRGLINWVHRAMENGADVRGYMYWSLLDNYEWAEGFEKRFGLVEIDYETLERKIRPSAYEYKKIIEVNGL